MADFEAHCKQLRAQHVAKGIDVPSHGEAFEVWQCEALRRWTAGNAAKNVADREKLVAMARSEIPLAAVGPLRDDLAAAPSPGLSAVNAVLMRCDAKSDVEGVLRAAEATMCLYYSDDAASDMCDEVLKLLRSRIKQLEERGILAMDTSGYPRIHAWYVLHNARRALLGGKVDTADRLMSVTVIVKESCAVIPSAAAKKLAQNLSPASPPAARDFAQMIDAVLPSIPLTFPDMESDVRRRVPSYRAPTLRVRSASPETLGDMLNAVQDKREADVGAKRVRFDAVAPSSIPQRQTTVHTLQPRPPQPVADRPVPAVSTDARFPGCESKYHARYSSRDKHASAKCRYCTVCHCMEFLFNGCRRDCCWGHKPTERRITLLLRGHPDVKRQALQRMVEFGRAGFAEPTEIPL